jgi:hypothetical protein
MRGRVSAGERGERERVLNEGFNEVRERGGEERESSGY